MITLSSHITASILKTRPMTKNILLAFLGSIIIAGFAQIKIPLYFTPVPITGQTFAVLSVGMALGARYGALSLIMYLVEGAIGIPVFAGGGYGFAVLLGTGGGYLFGFVLAAYAVGFLAQKGWDRSFLRTCIAMLIGNIILYIPGLIQIGVVAGWDKPIFTWGLIPFIPGDLIKVVIASSLFPLLWKKVSRTNDKKKNISE